MLHIKEVFEQDADDLFDRQSLPADDPKRVDVICITTNGTIDTRGHLVTGAGIAQWATEKFGMLDEAPDNIKSEAAAKFNLVIGNAVLRKGNIPVMGVVRQNPTAWFYTFPVKNNWWEVGQMDVIRDSFIHMLREWNFNFHNKKVWLPLPGCGMGQLKWGEVKRVLMPIAVEAEKYLHGEINFFTREKRTAVYRTRK